MMLAKKSGLGLLNPVTAEKEKYLSSQKGGAELFRVRTGEESFSNADRLLALREERRDRQENRDDKNKSTLKGFF